MENTEKILNFWKLTELFTPSKLPNLLKTIKKEGRDIPFDAYYDGTNNAKLPLENYKAYNDGITSDDKKYNRANIYCGHYKISALIEKLITSVNLDIEKYTDIYNLQGEFFIFSVQIDLDGKFTEEGVKVSPFFYAAYSMIKSKNINISIPIQQNEIQELNSKINDAFNEISNFQDVCEVKKFLFEKLKIKSEKDIGLESKDSEYCACKALKKDDETDNINSFYLNEIETVQKNYRQNDNVVKYVQALLKDSNECKRIDNNIEIMQNWLETYKFPMAKYPSKFSPTLMQQIAVNIAVAEKGRNENIFSVNGPPGTGKTTLLKEIIASNVEKLAEVLIEYGINNKKFEKKKIPSASNEIYKEYYTIPDEIAKYGILVVSNNNGAVENITLDLPKAGDMTKDKTRTDLFERKEDKDIYFSEVADKLLKKKNSAWGLISACMGRTENISNVLNKCVFSGKSKNNENKNTLDGCKDDTLSWEEAVNLFNETKADVISKREDIEKDRNTLKDFYNQTDILDKEQLKLNSLCDYKDKYIAQLAQEKELLDKNEKQTLQLEDEIKYIKKHSSFIEKIFIIFNIGETAKNIFKKKQDIHKLVSEHFNIKQKCDVLELNIKETDNNIEKQKDIISEQKSKVEELEGKVYKLKFKYKNNFADKDFYLNITESEESQNSCPWTYDEYDEARERLFSAALQVRKAFILNSEYIKRNLYIYRRYNIGKYTIEERREMFSHLLNALFILIPVLSSTFASVGNFLRYAGNKSLGTLIIDEAGQAVPYSALGAIYRCKQVIVVGDPLQVEPVVTIPQFLVDLLADGVGVPEQYKSIENSVQTFADAVNEFKGEIGERKVGCPLVVHRRCIEPMFSISNRISYNGRMFNKTNKKEEYLKEDQPFLIKKSGWINVKGEEISKKNHFVKNQADKVCQLLEKALYVYEDLFNTDNKIFIITPFRTVADKTRTFIVDYFTSKGYEDEMLKKWTDRCVGTVHTFQGKDANEVLFVLGCSEKSSGAMNWVVNKANILNVACTRAKYRIAFIGNFEDWKNKTYFKDFIPKQIDKIDI